MFKDEASWIWEGEKEDGNGVIIIELNKNKS